MRILIITHNYPQNKNDRKDAGIFLNDFAHALSKENQVFILAPNFVGSKETDTKVPVTWFNWGGGAKKLGNLSFTSAEGVVQSLSLLWHGSKETYRFCKTNQIDFVLAAWAFPSGFFAFINNLFTSMPYATWSLGSDINIYARYPLVKQFVGFILKRATLRFSNSYALCKKVELLSGKKCLFLPAITDIVSVRLKKSKKRNPFTFLFVGRLEEVKGVDILLSAAALIPPSDKWRVLIGGEGTKKNKLLKMLKELKLERNVKFLGRLGSTEVPKYMNQSNFLVIPSRSESLPLVMIEAAKMNLPG